MVEAPYLKNILYIVRIVKRGIYEGETLQLLG
jgi:hypothetical protein